MDNSTLPDNEWLVNYLDGELTGDERLAAEERIAADPRLREELEGLRLAREAVRQYGLREKVRSIHAEMSKPAARVRHISTARRIFRYGMAVAATLLLAAGIFLAYYFFSLSSDGVYASTYHPFEMSNVRSGESPSPVIKAYRDKNFQEVIRLAQGDDGNNKAHLFLSGVSHLQLNNTPAAIADLEKLESLNKGAGEALFGEETDYYLALAYIRNRDYDQALPLLEKMQGDEQHTYHSKITKKLIRDVKLLKWR